MRNSKRTSIIEKGRHKFIDEGVETKAADEEMENAHHVNPIFSLIKPVKCYVSKGGREKELHHINSIEDHRDEPERIKRVRFFEAKNRVMHIPKSAAQPPKCTLETIKEGVEFETIKVENEDQVSSSTPLSAKPAASMSYQCTLEPTEEEEVEADAIFDGEAAGDEELHDPTTIVNVENQVPINAPFRSSSRLPTTNTYVNQSEVTLSKIRISPSQSLSGKGYSSHHRRHPPDQSISAVRIVKNDRSLISNHSASSAAIRSSNARVPKQLTQGAHFQNTNPDSEYGISSPNHRDLGEQSIASIVEVCARVTQQAIELMKKLQT